MSKTELNEPRWVMHVPVLSTLHLPGPAGFEALRIQGDSLTSEGDLTMVCYMVDCLGGWQERIADWVWETFEDNWVRFDPDGDVIPELPTFEEEWP